MLFGYNPVTVIRSGASVGSSLVEFANTLYVDPNSKSVGVKKYTSINGAIDYINNLPLDLLPTASNPYKIILPPGTFSEAGLFLPDYVSIIGSGRAVTHIVGSGAGTGGGPYGGRAIINACVGCTIEGVSLDPSGFSSKSGAMVVMRNGEGLTTPNEGTYDIVAGTTLILQINADPIVTLTFGTTETITASTLAGRINTLAAGTFIAIARFDRALILNPIGSGTDSLTVKKEGTANTVLGFSTAVDTIAQSREGFVRQWPILKNYAIDMSLGNSCEVGIYSGVLWSSVHDGTIYGGDVGVWTEFGNLTIRDTYVQESLVNSVKIGTDLADVVVLVEAENCEFWGNVSSTDIKFVNPAAYMKAKNANYQTIEYATADSVGQIHPTGSRNIIEFVASGTLTVGTYIAGPKPIHYNSLIEGIVIMRQTAGSGGSTIIDINYPDGNNDPLTLYTTQANRPTVAAADGDRKVIRSALPDIKYIPKDSWLSVDIDQVEGGSPEGIIVQVQLMRVGEV